MNCHCVRLLLPATAATVCLVAAVQSSASAETAPPDISGVYWATTYSPRIEPVGGGDLPYKPEALAEYKKNMAESAAGKLDDRSRSYCLPDGVPRALEDPYPFEIVQAANRGEIYLLYEI